MEIHREIKEWRLWLTYSKYNKKALAKFNIDISLFGNSSSTIFQDFCCIMSHRCNTRGLMSTIMYDNVVGSFMYLMVSTRLNIAHVVELVSKYMVNLGKVNWEVVEWILSYLYETSEVG